jgi:hypothetical protein
MSGGCRHHGPAPQLAEELAPMVRLWFQLTVDHTPNSEWCCRG